MDSLKSTARSTRASLSRAKRSLALKFKSLPSLKPGQQISGHKSLSSCRVSGGPPAVPPRVDRTTLAKSANAQDNSLFLARLPYDIRLLIYEYVWAAAGTDQHIVQIRIGSPPSRPRPSRQASANRELTHFPCLCSPPKDGLGDGSREGGPAAAAATRRRRRVNRSVGGVNLGTDIYWSARNQFMRPWCPHWECDYVPSGADYTYLLSESSRRSSFKGDPPWDGPPSPFLGVILACKRMYLESVVSLYENIRFCFMDYFHLETFLRMTPLEHLRNIRSIHLCECVSANLFMCEDRTAPRWTAVWSLMPLLERLKELHVWLYPSWVGRGSELPEDNLLRIMYNVGGVPKFVVEIPRDERQEEEVAVGKHRDAPFRLIRPIVPELGRDES